MSSFSVDGLVSGLDTTSLIGQLMQLERMPQQRLQATLTQQTSSVSAYQSIATRLKAVDTAAAALSKDSSWDARSVAVTGTSASATAGARAATGRNTVEVHSLAAAATWTAAAGAGLDDTVVTAEPPELRITNAKGEAVTVGAGSGSLRDVVEAINRVPDSGLSAVAVKVGTDSYRLQIRAAETGTASRAAYLAGLDVAPQEVPAVDAAYSVNDLRGSSTSNTVTDLLPGVTVTFAQTGTSTVTVAADRNPTSAALKAMVDEVNKVLTEVAKHTVTGANGAVRGVLAGDAGTRAIASDLLAAVTAALPGGGYAAQVGIQTTKEGRLVFDQAVFETAYAAQPSATRALLSSSDSISIGKRLTEVVERVTDPVRGSITSSIQGRERTATDLRNQIEGWDRRLEVRQTILSRQFSGLEVALGRMQSQSGWLASQLSSLSSGSGR